MNNLDSSPEETFVSAVTWWTPERGGLESDASVRGLQRWTRVLVSVVEDAAPSQGAEVLVVVATRSGAADFASDGPALRLRWPTWDFVAVHADDETVPLSLVEAMGNVGRFAAVVWATVELTAAAEFGAAVRLDARASSCRLRVEHSRKPAPALASAVSNPRGALNPCAAALELARGIETAPTSIRVGQWGIHVSSPVPYR